MYEKWRRKKQKDAFRAIAYLLEPAERPLAGCTAMSGLNRSVIVVTVVTLVIVGVVVGFVSSILDLHLPPLLVPILFAVVFCGVLLRQRPFRWLVRTDRRLLILHVSNWRMLPTDLIVATPASDLRVERLTRFGRWTSTVRILTIALPDGSSVRLGVERLLWGSVVDSMQASNPPPGPTYRGTERR